MKLVTFRRDALSPEEIGVLKGDKVLPVAEAGLEYETMNDLILNMKASEKGFLEKADKSGTKGLPLSELTLCAPIPHPLQDVLCLGMNYKEHAEEAAKYSDEAFRQERPEAVFFSKRVSCSQGDGAPIPAHSDLTERLDFENELGVIIGRDACNVSEEEAYRYIFGYTIINDVSARDLQTRHKQWYFGKSLDGFTPMGPCIVTADEIDFPPALAIRTTLNGQLRQNSNTSLLIHPIAEIISELSKGMTLKAGTIIATGTPKGVLMGMDEPVFLKPGDVIACTIEGIGTLTNYVKEER